MINVLLLGGPADGQRREVHGVMRSCYAGPDDNMALYQVVALCSHGEVHWFGVLDGADPLALLIAGYGVSRRVPACTSEQEELDAFIVRAGFSYGWKNLESWARRMAEQAVKELTGLS